MAFFLAPFVGGLGSPVVSQTSRPSPARLPNSVTTGSPSPVYPQAYADGYRSTYQPRYRRAARTSVLVTSTLSFAGAAAFGG